MSPSTATCTICLRRLRRVSTGQVYSNRNRVFVDHRGRRWSGGWCPDCKQEHHRRWKVASGKKRHIDQVQYPSIARGREAERVVARVLAQSGRQGVKLNEKVIGPDVTFCEGGAQKKVEVKRAYVQKSHGKYEYWLVERVRPARLKDEYCAIVTPSNDVHLFDMVSHLAACRKDGRRNVTELCKGRK
jgi:hypothetical protein